MSRSSPALAAARRELWDREAFSFIPRRTLTSLEGAPPDAADDDTPSDAPRVVFAGFPSHYSLAFLLALLELPVRIAGIVSSPRADPAVSGHNALAQVAAHLGIPLLLPERINDESGRAALHSVAPDAVVMASFDQIIRGSTLQSVRHGWLNVHPSALPRYRGSEPVWWTIYEGAPSSGITLHRAAPRFDAGAILEQRITRVDPEDTSGTLTRRLCEVGTDALGPALRGLVDGAPGVPPDACDETYRGSVGHRNVGTAHSVGEALRLVRAGNPDIPAYEVRNGRTQFILRAIGVPAAACETGDLPFEDGCVRPVEVIDRCRCAEGGGHAECPRIEDRARA